MKKTIYATGLGLLLSLGSCNDQFLERIPLDAISDASFWQNGEQLQLAVNGCYAYLKGKNTVDLENLGDNTLWPTVTDYQRISTGNYTDDLGGLNSEWTFAYDGIRRCNHFLENYDRADATPELKARYASEVRFIRAYLYSYLTLFFGDVPLVVNTLTADDEQVYGPRDPQVRIVEFILTELEESAAALPTSYPAADFGRITKGAALALKARTALYHQRYALAEAAAKAVMDLNVYQLYSNGDPKTSYRELFMYRGQASTNPANKETILARVHTPDVSVHNLSREIQVPDQAVRWNPTKSLVDAYLAADGLPIGQSPLYSEKSYADIFKNRDPRMTQTILAPGSDWKGLDDGDPDSNPNAIFNLPKFNADKKGAVTVTGYYFTKYVEPSTVGLVSRDENDIHLIRYAEVLLTYAEALLEQNKLTQAALDATVNRIRARVGMVPMKLTELAATGLTIRDELRRERRVELALEGQRYFDLLRWQQGPELAKDVRGIKKSLAPNQADVAPLPVDAEGYLIANRNRTFVAPKNYRWPVPFVQRERNPALGQNAGW